MSAVNARDYIHPSVRAAFRINLERAESGGYEHPQAFKDKLIDLIEGGMSIRDAGARMGLNREQADSIWQRRER